jgi:hypothetical protein
MLMSGDRDALRVGRMVEARVRGVSVRCPCHVVFMQGTAAGAHSHHVSPQQPRESSAAASLCLQAALPSVALRLRSSDPESDCRAVRWDAGHGGVLRAARPGRAGRHRALRGHLVRRPSGPARPCEGRRRHQGPVRTCNLHVPCKSAPTYLSSGRYDSSGSKATHRFFLFAASAGDPRSFIALRSSSFSWC